MYERTYYYARVSSGEQNLDRQLDAFRKLGAEERFIFTDKASGKNLNRDNYMLLRNNILRPGDTLVIKSLDRLSRNKTDIKNELEYYRRNNIRVKIIDLPTTMSSYGEDWIIDMVNNLIIEVLSSIAEQERAEIKKRQAEGIAAAKEKGKRFGRQPFVYPENWDEVCAQLKNKTIKGREAAALLGISRATLYKYMKIYETELKQENGASSPINELSDESEE